MNYSTIPTSIGAAKLRNASLLGQTLSITRVAFGDGGGAEYEPTGQETELKNQVFECIPNRIAEEGSSPTWIELEAVIPHNVGGWHLREVGCFDEAGDLIFIGNLPSSFKPSGEAGVIKDLVFEMVYDAVAADVVQIKIDPNVVIATRRYVDDALFDLMQSAQCLPWDANRTYKTGEICSIETNGEIVLMQMYAGPNLTCKGKDPSDPKNRQVGWDNAAQPFWWIPYKSLTPGLPFSWLSETAPEGSVMEVGANLPVSVYWRLAREYPSLVNNGVINTGDIRAVFIRGFDGGRGFDAGRKINSYQSQNVPEHNHDWGIATRRNNEASLDSVPKFLVSISGSEATGGRDFDDYSSENPPSGIPKSGLVRAETSYSGSGADLAPGNVARLMCISI